LTNAEVLNLLPGGRLLNDFLVGEDAVLNVQGGVVGNDLQALAASTINIEAGIVGSRFLAQAGSTVTVRGGRLADEAEIHGNLTITGGVIGNNLDVIGGVTTFSGGRIGWYSVVREDAMLRMTGGILDDVDQINNFEMRGGTVGRLRAHNSTYFGTDFRLDGHAITGLNNTGDEVRLTLPDEALITGVLTDGTPFVFFNAAGYEDDVTGTVRLVREDTPPAASVINIPGDPVPYGIRAGQTLNLHPGGSLPDHFTAGEGSTLNVYGGSIGRNFEAFGATVNIYDGYIGDSIDSGDAFLGTVINMSGGRIDGGFTAWRGSTVNLINGQIGPDFHPFAGSTFNMSGGSVGGGFAAWTGSRWNLSGGRVGSPAQSNGFGVPTLTIRGIEFQLDGEPVEGLNAPGDQVVIPTLDGTGARLTGRLEDGTPFSFRDSAGQRLRNPVRLVLAEPLARPTIFNVPSDPAPLRVGARQILNLYAGGSLPESFIAAPGSVVNIEDGLVGDFFQAVDSQVNIRSGEVGSAFDAFAGAMVTISGGTFGPTFEAYPGSTITIEGTHFSLDGMPIGDLDEPGDSIVLNTRGNHTLKAILTDGSIFDLILEPRPDALTFARDYVDPAATLQLVFAAPAIPEPGALVLCILAAAMAIGLRWIVAAPR
jgi:hypothetical protein